MTFETLVDNLIDILGLLPRLIVLISLIVFCMAFQIIYSI